MFGIIVLLTLVYITYKLYRRFNPTPDIVPNGKAVLISGCDSGFGHGLALQLDKLGFRVFAGMYSEGNVESLKMSLSRSAVVFKLDITKKEDIDHAFQIVNENTESLHALVNNAGIGSGGYIDWVSVDFMRRMMDVNFFGHVTMTKTFLPLLIKKRDSRVVNICSVAGYLTKPGMSAYAASKYALESFSDCLRREMAVWGLRVSIIEPGFMRTNIVQGHAESLCKLWDGLDEEVQKRWGVSILEKQVEEVENNIFMKKAEDPKQVVDALTHAVMNSEPNIRYRPGWQSSYVMFPLSRGPAWLVDWLMIRPTLKHPLPAGIQKQTS